MVVEIMGAELPQGQAKDGVPLNIDDVKPNQGSEYEEPIKFGAVDGSHGMSNWPSKGDSDPSADAKFPKDAVDEWPAPKQIHSFYFVRFRSYEDPKLKAKTDQAEKEIEKKNQARSQLTDTLRAKRVQKNSFDLPKKKKKENLYTYLVLIFLLSDEGETWLCECNTCNGSPFNYKYCLLTTKSRLNML